MEMISVSVPANARGAAILIGFASVLGGEAKKVPDDRAGKRGRPKKEAAAPADDDFDLSGDEPEAEPEETEDDEAAEEAEDDEAPEAEDEPEEKPVAKRGRPVKAAPAAAAPAAKATKGHTLEGDIIPAFQKFADKHSREKAGKVLAKYGVKSVRDLPKEKYPEILKLLKV